MSLTHSALLAEGTAVLRDAGIEGAGGDALRLLRWATGHDGAALMSRMPDIADEMAVAKFGSAVAERAGRVPLSHIVGGRAFWGRWFTVSKDVLDPRPESEIMISAALAAIPGRPEVRKVLDLGVGSGCLLGTVLAELPEAMGVGIDASRAALAVAKANLVVQGVADRAILRMGDWLDGLEESFDLILCNPPYIAEAEMHGLSPEVREHEPLLALTPGGDGLGPYRRIAPELAAFLRRGGRALFEIGPAQAQDVTEIFAAFGWPPPIIHRDFDGRDRCLEYRR
jgi:release factor glutamine methyltransferase